MSAVNLKEEDLYFPVKDYLMSKGYSVKGEVKHCDITAVNGEELLIVEMKTSLNLEVILQSVLRQRLTNLVYIAVPKNWKAIKSKRWKNIIVLLKRLGIGLLIVDLKGTKNNVQEILSANLTKCDEVKISKQLKKATLKEFEARHGDQNKGGISKTKIITAYREMSINIALKLKENGELSSAQLIKLGTDKEKTYKTLYNNHYGWFQKATKGKYTLTQAGIEALEEFANTADYFKDDENEWEYL